MSTTFEDKRPNLQELLLQNSAELVQNAAKRQQYGSFADRNPALGKMVRCVWCKKRRRQNDPVPCCSGKFKGE